MAAQGPVVSRDAKSSGSDNELVPWFNLRDLEPEPGYRHVLYLTSGSDVAKVNARLADIFGPLHIGNVGVLQRTENYQLCSAVFERCLTPAEIMLAGAQQSVLIVLRPYDTRYAGCLDEDRNVEFPKYDLICRVCQKCNTTCDVCEASTVPSAELWKLSDSMERAGIPDECALLTFKSRRADSNYARLPGGALVRCSSERCPFPNYFEQCTNYKAPSFRVVKGAWAPEDVYSSGTPPPAVYDRFQRSYVYSLKLPIGSDKHGTARVMLRSFGSPIPPGECARVFLETLTKPRIYRKCMALGHDWETLIGDRQEEIAVHH